MHFDDEHPTRSMAKRLVLRIAGCGMLTWFIASRFPLTTVVAVVVPLWGVALARPLVECAAWLLETLRRAGIGELEGRYHEFQGLPLCIRIRDRQLWVEASGLLAVLEIRTEQLTRRRFADAECMRFRDSRQQEFSLLGIRRLVSISRALDRHKFLLWLEREVVFPHDEKRKRDLV